MDLYMFGNQFVAQVSKIQILNIVSEIEEAVY